MTNKTTEYYWDSAIFLSYLKGEQRKEPDVTQAIKDNWLLMHEGKIKVYTSILTKSEVLQYQMGDEQYQKFLDYFYSDRIERLPTDEAVWDLAFELRNYHAKKVKEIGYLSVPDAVHLASAIIVNADEFHTLDGSKEKKLIRLSGNVGGKYKLIVCHPSITFKGSKDHLFSATDKEEKD